MSMCYNDYIIASNNSINENKYNAEKLAKSPSYRIKKILKPILRILRQKSSSNTKKSQKSKNQFANTAVTTAGDYSLDSNHCCYDHYECQHQNDHWSSEIDENFANEELESRILNEIADCQDDAAIYVYHDDECELQAINRETTFIPVHFARTEAGTFFWTTMQKQPIDDEDTESTHCWSQCGDRWVQA